MGWARGLAHRRAHDARTHSHNFSPSLALGAAQKLLDDTGDQIDQSNTGLVRETARVEHVTKEAGTCWLYMAICLLLLVLIGLILGRWA